ncbi:MAG: response regulator [Caldithrix sp.]|nr:response regulator [Caldithrix sp.]
MKFNILILDDERMVGNSLKRIIEDDNKKVFVATHYDQAKEFFKKEVIDLLLLDYKLGSTSGLDILKEIREYNVDLAVVMVTAYGSIELAVEAMKLGAIDFIQKKVEAQYIRFTVQRVLDNLRLRKEVEALKADQRNKNKFPYPIANSPSMQEVMQLADEFAKSDSIILLQGETGVGKNFLAEYIHYQSARFKNPFITLNCSAIPRHLIESELFGYEAGAFTGARQKGKKGLIEQAHGGTLFLDEIGELTLDLQTKLLHILEQNAFLRLGAEVPTTVDVRFMAATNADLHELVQKKKFRLDLFYRLNVAMMDIPPLRERKADILPLSKIFIEHFNQKLNKSVLKMNDEAEKYLLERYWKGNVRELRNSIERAMLLKKDDAIALADFPHQNGDTLEDTQSAFSLRLDLHNGGNLLHEAQKQTIIKALELTDDNVSKAAALLGVPRTSLNSCINRFNIRR